MAAILFFFLFHFHLIALQSEAGASGVQWDVAAYGEEPVEVRGRGAVCRQQQ